MLNDDQKVVLRKFTSFLAKRNQKDLIIEGQAGTGKGYLLHHIRENWESIEQKVKLLDEDFDFDIAFTATTNEAVGQMHITEAITIYKLAGLRPDKQTEFKITKPSMMTSKLVVVIDEASYIGKTTYEFIRKQIPNAKIVWVMDKYQLAPVNELYPYVATLGFEELSLTKVERNKGAIQSLCFDLRKAVANQQTLSISSYNNDDSIVVLDDEVVFQRSIMNRYKEYSSPSESRVVCYHNKRVGQYNYAINSKVLGNPDFPYVGCTCIMNKYNDKIGIPVGKALTIKEIGGNTHFFENKRTSDTLVVNTHLIHTNRATIEIPAMDIPYGYFNINVYGFGELALPYSMTTHKAQGSTVDEVFVDLRDIMKCRCKETIRRLVYVAVSRARLKVTILV